MSLAYISISKNKRKTKINGEEKLTTTYAFTIYTYLQKGHLTCLLVFAFFVSFVVSFGERGMNAFHYLNCKIKVKNIIVHRD